MPDTKPADVDEFIAAAPEAARPHLESLRKLMLAAIPGVDEGISWNVPYYKHRGEIGGFSVASKHVAFGFGAGVLSDDDRKALEDRGYKLGKETMQIKFGQEVPADMVTKILKTKKRQNEEKSA